MVRWAGGYMPSTSYIFRISKIEIVSVSSTELNACVEMVKNLSQECSFCYFYKYSMLHISGLLLSFLVFGTTAFPSFLPFAFPLSFGRAGFSVFPDALINTS